MTNARPSTLAGCDVLPPMDSPDDRLPTGRTSTKGRRRMRPAAGRFHQINAFVDATVCNLDRAEIVVWLILWRDTKTDGLARTSQADLARRGGISERSAGRAVRNLRQAGLLTIVRRGGLRQGPSAYRVHPISRAVAPHAAVRSKTHSGDGV